MIKRFHEAPKCIFKDVQKVTDGDYALVNLFEDDLEYYSLFRNAVKQGREVILDNGVFELGEAWDAENYAYWIRELEPTYYIVPDVLEHCAGTVKSFFDFIHTYPNLPGKIMGVAQGESYENLVACYKIIEPFCDKICIGFDYSWYQNTFLAGRATPGSDVACEQACIGRQSTLLRMLKDDVINIDKPHHLLGVMLPQEVRMYGALQKVGMLNWIDSIDTSNPVVHGLKGTLYNEWGLPYKDTQKLYTLINSEVSTTQYELIMENIDTFRRFCNGD